jgi:hypothetical protein
MTLRDLSVTAAVGAVAGVAASAATIIVAAIVLERIVRIAAAEQFSKDLAAAARAVSGR